MSGLLFENEKIAQFRQLLEKAKRVAIISHTSPDGDNIGSVLALREVLTTHLGKPAEAVSVVLPDPCPSTMRCLHGSDSIVDARHAYDECHRLLSAADVVMCLDFNTPSRVGILTDALVAAPGHKILIDHHVKVESDTFCLVFSLPDLSATCELLYWIVLQTWGRAALNRNAARCLYYGICTDTGSFRYACNDSSLYEAAAGLVAFDIDAAAIHNEIDNAYSVQRMHLLAFLLNERLRIFEEEGFAYFYVSLDDLQRFQCRLEDLEGIVNYTLMMKPIQVGALIREDDNGTVRLSLRSKYDFDVNIFAQRHFGGGGHVKAAGATLHGNLANLAAQVEELLHQTLKKS